MTVLVRENSSDLAMLAGDVIEQVIRSSTHVGLGLATGGTVGPIYQDLIARHRRGLSFANAAGFLLDEYVGLDPDHPQAYRNVIRTQLINHIDLPDHAMLGPYGPAIDLAAEAARYDAIIREARIDVQLLGIGRNGHIAFNEPGASLASVTRVVDLTKATRDDNARFFSDAAAVPRRALSQGIDTILRARHILLVASGDDKADAVGAALEGPVSCAVPASALQLHGQVTYLLDQAAARQLTFSAHSGH